MNDTASPESAELKYIVEAALLAAEGPLSLNQLKGLFLEAGAPSHGELRKALAGLSDDYAARGIEVKEVATGFRIQVRPRYMEWIGRLWQERPPRYSRALLETLAIIAYRQPVTRGEIEHVRGVAVSTNIVRTLLEREWIQVVGHRDVPGKPALLGTTKGFLDYFNLKSLDDLPTLAEIRDIGSIAPELELVHDAAPAQADASAETPAEPDEQAVSDADGDPVVRLVATNGDARADEVAESDATR